MTASILVAEGQTAIGGETIFAQMDKEQNYDFEDVQWVTR